MIHHALARVAAVTPSPSPTPEYDENLVTPGVVGFVVTFAMALLVILLVFDMVRRVRRVNYRAQVTEQLDAEERERHDAEAAGDVDIENPDRPDADRPDAGRDDARRDDRV